MTIPTSITMIICLITFLIALYEYYVTNLENRIVNPYFGLAVGAIVMEFANTFLRVQWLSPWMFLLAVVWCGLTVYQLPRLPKWDGRV
jgi:FtsH-binding integral membrane protein